MKAIVVCVFAISAAAVTNLVLLGFAASDRDHFKAEATAYRAAHRQMCDRIRGRLLVAGMIADIDPQHPEFRAEPFADGLMSVYGLDIGCVRVPPATLKARQALFQRGGPDPAVLAAGVRALAVAMDEAAGKDWPLNVEAAE
jgi:hypothetical protein